jgi:serine/threonine protein kinase
MLKNAEHWRKYDADFMIASAGYEKGHVFKHKKPDGTIEDYIVSRPIREVTSEDSYYVLATHGSATKFLKIRKPLLNKYNVPEDVPTTMQRARHEYKMLALLNEIGNKTYGDGTQRAPGFCKSRAVCSELIFVDAATKNTIVTVFPWSAGSETLQQFLTRKDGFYASWHESEKAAYHKEILKLGVWLCGVIHKLNTLHIYHGDISLDNIVVSSEEVKGSKVPRITRYQLINFGYSCAHSIDPVFDTIMQRFKTRERTISQSQIADELDLLKTYGIPPDDGDIIAELDCTKVPKVNDLYFYVCNLMYRDPKAGRGTLAAPPLADFRFDSRHLLRSWPLFEMFSCAIVLQLMCDREQNVAGKSYIIPEQRENNGVPVIRETATMPAGLSRYLMRMTGPHKDRGDLAGVEFILSQMLGPNVDDDDE